MPLWVWAVTPSADSSCRMRPRTASASGLPAGWGRCSPRMRPRTASARAAENWVDGASGPDASGRQGANTDNSQIPATSTTRLIMRPIPVQIPLDRSHILIFGQIPLFCGAERVGRHSGRRPWAPRVAPLLQERATTSVTSSGAEAGVIEVIETSELSPPAAEASAADGFADLGLCADILKAVADAGYTTPTPIQAQGIPEVLKRRDVIGIAQTGTGKTASFTLPMIEMLSRGRSKARMPRALVLEPTRELADQVSESFDKYSKYSKLSHALLIGGVSMDDQIKKLDRGVDVLIATPGRLMDHFERGRILLSQVNILVIDEADRMLDMGFIPDVEKICKLLPFTRQTLFYSATMPPEIQRLTDQFLHNPVRIEVSRPATTASNISQEVVEIPANDWAKREALRRLIREAEPTLNNAIVFCNRKRDVDVV